MGISRFFSGKYHIASDFGKQKNHTDTANSENPGFYKKL
jgi:hypothetical protein